MLSRFIHQMEIVMCACEKNFSEDDAVLMHFAVQSVRATSNDLLCHREAERKIFTKMTNARDLQYGQVSLAAFFFVVDVVPMPVGVFRFCDFLKIY